MPASKAGKAPTRPAAVRLEKIAPPKAASPSQKLLDTIKAQLEDAKAEQIAIIDLMDKSSLADTMVLATGRSNRHVGAIADHLVEKLKLEGWRDIKIEGLEQADWVVVDTGDVIVHLFRPEVRSFYNLERLWSPHSPDESKEG